MEDFPTLQGPRNSTMGLEVISPSGRGAMTTVIKVSAEERDQETPARLSKRSWDGLSDTV